MRWFNFTGIMVCIAITALNQYVTHCNSRVWLAGEQYNLEVAAANELVYEAEMLYADAMDQVDIALSLADSERIRAEKLQYERDAAVDANRRMRAYINQLHRKCEEAGVQIDIGTK